MKQRELLSTNSHNAAETSTPPFLQPLSRWLSTQGDKTIAIYASFVAWATYFCIYGYRKPWSAATWTSTSSLGGMDPKSWLTISQTIGYLLGKVLSIGFVTALAPEHRFRALVLLPLLSMIVWILMGATAYMSPYLTCSLMFFSTTSIPVTRAHRLAMDSLRIPPPQPISSTSRPFSGFALQTFTPK